MAVRRETSRTFTNKKRKYLKEKMSLKETVKTKISKIYVGV